MATAGNNQFVRSTTVRSRELLSIDGGPIWSSWNDIFNKIDTLCGAGASRVFAAPTNVNRQPDGETLNVAWFSSYNDEPRPLDALDGATRTRVHGDLTAALARLQPALGDPLIGESVGAMLNIYDDKSIFAIGEHAVITNWGALPSGASTAQAGFARHSAATIGPFLSSGVTPRIPGQSWIISGNSGSAGISPPPLAKEAALHTSGTNAISSEARAPGRFLAATTAPWLLGALAAMSVGALAYIAWPGNLVYEKHATLGSDAAADSERQALDAGLQERIGKLNTELGKNACSVDKSLLGMTLNPDLRHSTTPRDSTRQDASTTPVTGQTPLDKIDAATVLVITQSGIGSGFFVNATDILSNRHVVETAGDTVFVANKAFDRAIQARVVAKSADGTIGTADFALLRLQHPATGVSPLQFTTNYERNDNVLAGGFPFAVLSEDDIFNKVMAGDSAAISSLQLVPTPGTIWLLPHGGTVQRITHSAEISPGNSGGPLVDACGNVVGINTFIKTDGEILQKLNFAIASQDAIAFLNANGVHPTTIDMRCVPERQAEEDRS